MGPGSNRYVFTSKNSYLRILQQLIYLHVGLLVHFDVTQFMYDMFIA